MRYGQLPYYQTAGNEVKETEESQPLPAGPSEERTRSPQFRVRVVKVFQQDASLYRRPKEDSMRNEFQALFGSVPHTYLAA